MASPKESERRRTKDPKSRSPRDATPGGGSGRRSGRGSGCHVETQQFAPKQHAVLEQQSAVDKGSFSSAFSSYLQAKPTGVDFTLSRPSTVRSSASSPATGGVDSLRHAKATTAPNASCSTGDTNRSECRDSESESPHNVVLQILSLGSGSLRLSWVYDWSSVPTEFKDEGAMINGFQVVRRDESTDEKNVVRCNCSRPPLNIDVPAGHRYTFEVSAIVLSACDVGDAAEKKPLWQSSPSSPVVADLRRIRTESSEGRSVHVSEEWRVRSQPHAVASRMSTFLVEHHASAASSTASPVSIQEPTEHTRGSSALFLPLSPCSGGTKRGWCESPLGMHQGHAQSSHVLWREASEPIPATERCLASLLLPREHTSPLMLSEPRMVSCRPLDPIEEKNEMSDRLLARSCRSTRPRWRPLPLPVQVNSKHMNSTDTEDNQTLQHISHAFNSLERFLSSKPQGSEDNEGHNQSVVVETDDSKDFEI